MQQINLDEASKHLSDLIEAALRGEEIVIAKDDQPVVKLTPVSPVNRRPQFGSAKGLVTISDDFDDPIEDFKDYM
ncbi:MULTISPECIES: type II toxin-antitoxin system Phd/YefM family antitoxin [Cyanophyceae]|uniref:type II toxin-antitoxin system Phd/YefM family antitoxin n=1 Tax=Cyanophyceae TaxID=3028117 RepID=UPI001684073B|nr:type II toxin-antitoxin system Phd/YefM family antitoxin [Trichocoleus sp. FACHB-40]MBD2004641.1 type II toxin-antitoxin system Phd/YefM family antitoxin [Trichocoleus sp. FACHB-40]